MCAEAEARLLWVGRRGLMPSSMSRNGGGRRRWSRRGVERVLKPERGIQCGLGCSNPACVAFTLSQFSWWRRAFKARLADRTVAHGGGCGHGE